MKILIDYAPIIILLTIGISKVLLFNGIAKEVTFYNFGGCFLTFQIFGSDPSCADYLKNLIEALFQHTTRILTNIQV
jgi:hypothetical protein